MPKLSQIYPVLTSITLLLLLSSCVALVGLGAQIFGLDHGSGRTHEFRSLQLPEVRQACAEAADSAGYSVDLRPQEGDPFAGKSSGYILRGQPGDSDDEKDRAQFPRVYIHMKGIYQANDEKRRIRVKVLGGPEEQRAILDHIRRLLKDPRPGDPLARPAKPGV